MKNLIEISKIVTKRKVKKIEIFDDHYLKHKSSKFNEFYEALAANKFKNDRDSASFLYGCSPTDPKYRQLKSRFKKRLLNTLFFLDVNLPSASNYERAYFSCNKDWTLVKILLSNNARHTASSLARAILTTALKFKFADVIVNCSRILREYSCHTVNDKAFEIYDAHIKQYSNVMDAEIRSEELFQRVNMNYFKPASKNPELREEINSYCDALVSLSEIYDSPVIFYNMYLVWILRFEMLQDYDGILEVCAQAEKYIEKKPDYYQEEKQIIFHTKKMSAYLHLGDYLQGRINAEKCLINFPEGSETWFNFMEYYLLLSIHTEHYIRALAIFNSAITNTKFKKLSGLNKEKWSIFEAYVNYIIESQKVNNPVLQKPKRKTFRVSRFINDPILYPKDQRNFTLLMIILQILFLLERKNFSDLPERIDRLKSYANRQLKKEEYYRQIQFIRLLQQLNKANFQIEDLSNTDKFYQNLLDRPFSYRGAISELEVIPYEKLWKNILGYLQ